MGSRTWRRPLFRSLVPVSVPNDPSCGLLKLTDWVLVNQSLNLGLSSGSHGGVSWSRRKESSEERRVGRDIATEAVAAVVFVYVVKAVMMG